MIVYRMHGPAYAAFDTGGTLLRAGRWHSAGTRVVYAAEHASLAALETLIHSGGRKIPPKAIAQITIPDEVMIETGAWLDFPDSQAFGDRWVAEARSAVLRVPSIAVNQMESNLVLNPAHADFARIQWSPSTPFLFDPRFFLAV
jgi:RES domain-containing protein